MGYGSPRGLNGEDTHTTSRMRTMQGLESKAWNEHGAWHEHGRVPCRHEHGICMAGREHMA